MKQENQFLLHAYEILPSGPGRSLSEESIAEVAGGGGCLWVHVDVNHPKTAKFIRKHFQHLEPEIVSSLLAGETRPRLQDSGEGSLIILRGINHNDPDEPEDMVSIRLWVEKDLVISAQRRPLRSVGDLAAKIAEGGGPANSGELLVFLTGRLLERMEPTFNDLDERLDAVEEAVISEPDLKEHHELSDIRKEAILYRRYITPQREVISHLNHGNQPWLHKASKRRLQDLSDQITRYLEDLDTTRERAQIIKDELTNALSSQMNKNLYLLSVIAAVFLPLGFLTGLFGINLAGMPGAENIHAFYVFSGLLAVVVVLQVLVFKRWKVF